MPEDDVEQSTVRMATERDIAKDILQTDGEDPEFDSNPYDEVSWKLQSCQPYFHKLFNDVSRDLTLANLSTIDKTKAEFSLSVAYQIRTIFGQYYVTKRESITTKEDGTNERVILEEAFVPQVCYDMLHDVAVICAAGRGFLGAQWDFFNTKNVRKEHHIREEKQDEKNPFSFLRRRRN